MHGASIEPSCVKVRCPRLNPRVPALSSEIPIRHNLRLRRSLGLFRLGPASVVALQFSWERKLELQFEVDSGENGIGAGGFGGARP